MGFPQEQQEQRDQRIAGRFGGVPREGRRGGLIQLTQRVPLPSDPGSARLDVPPAHACPLLVFTRSCVPSDRAVA